MYSRQQIHLQKLLPVDLQFHVQGQSEGKIMRSLSLPFTFGRDAHINLFCFFEMEPSQDSTTPNPYPRFEEKQVVGLSFIE
jgi:hypothetical protein